MISENILTFIKEIDRRDNYGNKMGLFQCSCKNKTLVEITIARVKMNSVKSCGCLKTKHGKYKTPEYRTYIAMKSRCYNKNYKRYYDYGGRGIKVCDRWLESFANFYADMGEKPSKEYSIHRVNNDGDYSPENCVWATPEVQSSKKRNSVFYPYNGESLTIKEWSQKTGLSLATIKGRLFCLGWSIEETLSTPQQWQRKDIGLKRCVKV